MFAISPQVDPPGGESFVQKNLGHHFILKKVSSMRTLLVVLCFLSLASDVTAQGAIERLKEMSVESACFEFPSIVHFDLTFSIESSKKDTLRIERYVGRFVKGRDRACRSDTLHIGDPEFGGEPSFEHMLCLPNGDRYVAFEAPSTVFYKTKLDPKEPPRVFVSHGNPFNFLMEAPSLIGRGKGEDVLKIIFQQMENLENHSDLLRSKSGTIVWKIDFDTDNAWQVNRWRSYFPKGGLRHANRGHIVKSIDETKNWVCVAESKAYWRNVHDVGPVPCWILSKDEGRNMSDRSEKTELEAFFFGFRFDNIPLDELFDEDRFNEKHLKEDFKIDDVKKLAENAKKEIERDRQKSSKK